VVDGSALWLGAAGFVVLAVRVEGEEFVVAIETTRVRVACPACGLIAVTKDRRRVRLRDVSSGGRPVIIEWLKRVWECADPRCETRTWTEQRPDFAGERRVLTERAAHWACDQLASLEGTTASVARRLGVSWSTVWAAVLEHARPLIDDPARVGESAMVGFDETVFTHATRGRRRRFVTCAVDTSSGLVIDVFEGRDSADLGRWLARQPADWCGTVGVVSVDPHEGYRNALINSPFLGEVTLVVDPFHIVRLANQALTRCRQRVQQEQLGHRGRARDPLYGARKLLLLGAERVDEAGWERIHAVLRAGDPGDEVLGCWIAKELVRDVYLTDDPAEAEAALDAALAWCSEPEATIEQRRLAKTLRRWRDEILAHHHTSASNGKVEAANVTIKQIKRSGRGFRNFANYRLRILLTAGRTREHQPVTRLRARPSSVA